MSSTDALDQIARRRAESTLPTAHIVFHIHTRSQYISSFLLHTLHYNVGTMRKDSALSFRIPRRLKAELERTALVEGRSLSQICEVFLTGGLDIYKKQGSKFVRHFFSSQRKEESAS